MKIAAQFLLLLVVGCQGVATQLKESDPPNFLFVLVDDLGWKDLGCYGSSFYETPACDRLAAEGMRFSQAYAACPVCSPTRASIQTGLYPARLATTDYFGAPQPDRWRRKTPLLPASYVDRLPEETTTIAEALGSAGYSTFFAGKWHLGGEGSWPEDHGYDVNQGGWTRGGPYGGNKYFSPYGNPRLEDGPEGEHLPARLAAETIEFIESQGERPFLAFLSFYSVHTPLISRQDLKEKYRQKKVDLGLKPSWGREGSRKVRLVQEHAVYAGMVEAMDQALGDLLDALDRLELEKNTVVIFMSDNGGLSTSEGHPTSNLPLRAGKGWLYEGGIREPMMVRWPGRVAAGSENNAVISSVDFFPTMLEMAGLPLPSAIDGKSFLAALGAGDDHQRGTIFWHYPHYGNQGGSPGGAIRDGRWKLIEFYEDGTKELYDLDSDIGEKKDLTSEHPGIAMEMSARLHRWLRQIKARMPSPNPSAEPGS